MPSAQEAVTLTELGFNVFPLEPRGKRPLTPNGCKDATRDNTTITTWWDRWPDANIGVATGPESGLYVIDIDGPDAETAWQHLSQPGDDDTLTVNTSRGRHLYYKCTDPLPNTASRIAPGIDTRGNGGYVVAPPSLHPTGATYEFAAARLPRQLPDWIRELVTPTHTTSGGDPTNIVGHPAAGNYAKTVLANLYTAVTKADPGTRNDTLNKAAFSAGRLIAGGVLNNQDVEMTLHAAASAADLGTQESQATIHSGVNAGMQHPWTPELRNAATNGGPPQLVTGNGVPNAPPQTPGEPASSWRPIDITQAANTPPPDPGLHHHIIYPQGRHLISGEPEAMKSWFALTAIQPVLAAGGTALVINTDGTPTWDIANRLTAIGLTDQDIRRVALVNPTDPPSKDDIQALAARGDTLVILDALDPAGHLIGADTNTSEGIQKVMRTLVDPFDQACVLIIDHVAKDKEARGRFSIGSQRKLAAVDVHIGLELIGSQPLTREGGEARTQITIHKDRFGGIRRGPKGRSGVITWTAGDGGSHVTHTVTDTHDEPRGTEWRPTVLMGRVSDTLQINGGAMTKNQINDATTGKKTEVLKAIQYMYADGYLNLELGPNNAELYTLAKPYEEETS